MRRGRLAARLLVGVFTCAALAVGTASVLAAAPGTPYGIDDVVSPDKESEARVPERLTYARDVDGDGVGDVYASSYWIDVNGVEHVGRAYLFSGRTRELIRVLDAPDPEAGAFFGFYISVPGDVNGDGVEDVTVGAPRVDGSRGRAYVFDGATGRLLRTLTSPDPQEGAQFGQRIGAAGDVNGDGHADIIVGAVGQDLSEGRPNAGQAFVFSGSSGELLRDYTIPIEDLEGACADEGIHHNPGLNCGGLGYSPQVIGDLNRDGVPDHMVAAAFLNDTGRIYVFSGADGTVLTRIDPPEQGDPGAFFGLQDTERYTPGDVTGDGVPEIYGSGFRLDKEGKESAGRAWVFDGAESLQTGRGVVLYELPDPTPTAGKAFGFTVSRTDYNRDGTPDLYVSNLTNHERSGNALPQESYIYEGRTGSLMKTLKMPSSEVQRTEGGGDDTGSGFGWSSRAPGDLNGDCEPDYVAAAPFQNVDGIQDVGKTYFFLSSGPSACPVSVTPPPVPPVSTCVDPAAAGYLHPAKLRVSRARVLRRDRRLDVLAPITSLAEGDVKVEFHADNRRDTFDEEVTEANTELDEIRILQRITRGQAELGTGIVNLEYLGDENTRPDFVRLRAASQRAELDVDEISLIGDRLSARGSVTDRAQGVVRFRYSYVDPDGSPAVHIARATIQDNGDWDLDHNQVPAQLAQCGGYLSIQFTGYFPRRIRGEQLAYQLNPGQTRTP